MIRYSERVDQVNHGDWQTDDYIDLYIYIDLKCDQIMSHLGHDDYSTQHIAGKLLKFTSKKERFPFTNTARSTVCNVIVFPMTPHQPM